MKVYLPFLTLLLALFSNINVFPKSPSREEKLIAFELLKKMDCRVKEIAQTPESSTIKASLVDDLFFLEVIKKQEGNAEVFSCYLKNLKGKKFGKFKGHHCEKYFDPLQDLYLSTENR